MSMLRKFAVAMLGLVLAGALVWAMWPQPLAVDFATVARGPMQGGISAQGVTRVREPYAITAPITGVLTRSPVEIGDAVIGGESVVAVLRPADPTLMDARSRAQAEAAVVEARAAVALAEANLRQAETGLSHARQELDRGRALAERGIIPPRTLDDLKATHQTAEQALESARSQLDLNRATLVRAEAQLLGPETTRPANGIDDCCVTIVAPQSGVVLSVADQSARLVQAGSPLLTIGNLEDLDVELDLLSADAVRVPLGARAEIDRWGGEGVLRAQVRRIDPAAFTHVSALGIEEQRVRLRLDLLDPPEMRPGLGDGFRVHVRLIVWEAEDVLQVPQAALFRQGEAWAAFVDVAGRAELRVVQVGRQSDGSAEVLGGLAEGDQVILYPAAALAPGSSIAPRAG